MRSPEAASAVLHRLRRRSTWVAALLFAAAWLGMRAIMGLPFEGLGLGQTLTPLVLLLGTLLLGPVPWQWTGGEAPMAPFLRGLLQALPWNAAWILLSLFLMAELGLPVRPQTGLLGAPPPRREPGPPRGEHPAPPAWDRPHAPRPQPGGRGSGPLAVGLTNLPLVLLLGWLLADRERTESSERKFQRLAEAAQGDALRAQMHPHVLFNALSGLTELVHEDPDAAEEALLELTRMLRLLLHQANQPLLPLREERELIRSYLTLEKIRLGAQLTVVWEWPDDVDGLAYPPLLLMPLVENAIKHGIAQSASGGVLRIQASREEGRLHLRVSNTDAGISRIQGHGLGHRNLEERLALLNPPGRFRITRETGLTTAELWLPLPEGSKP